MRVGLMVAAAVAAAGVSAPAMAATIIQTTSDGGQTPVFGFDHSLGTLTSASLTVNASKFRGFELALPLGVASDLITYSVAGNTYDTRLYSAADPTKYAYVQMFGSGTRQVIADQTRAYNGQSFTFFNIGVFANATVQLALGQFIDRGVFVIDGNDDGYYAGPKPAFDTTITSAQNGTINQLGGACYGYSNTGEDFCGAAAYTLTYTYTPAAAAVPEPAAWTMMVVGFCAAGSVFRRRSRRASLGGLPA